MKKKAHLLFLAAPPSSLSTIRTISKIRSLTSTIPSPLPNNQFPPPLRLHRLHLCPLFVTFEKFVVLRVQFPPPCQIISPLHPYRVYHLCMCSPFVQLVKFVVFQVLVRFYSIEKVWQSSEFSLVNTRTVYIKKSCLYLSQYQTVTSKVEEGPCQASRRACSWALKGMFSNREGHVLESREGRFDFYVCLWAFYFFTSRFLREFFLSRRVVLFSHRTHRFNRTFLRTVSSPQNASGIQMSQRPFN